jgi:hypothetical protein
MHAYEVHARISCMHLIGMHLIGVDLMRISHKRVFHRRGSHRHISYGRASPVDNFTKQFVCEVTPYANSPSPELALEIAPPIHPGSSAIYFGAWPFLPVSDGATPEGHSWQSLAGKVTCLFPIVNWV